MGKYTRTEPQLFVKLKTRRLNPTTSDRLLAPTFFKISSNPLDLKEDDENVITIDSHAITAAHIGDRTPPREVESMGMRKKNSNSCRPASLRMPSEDELEEFFAEAEKNLQQQFTEKYNFDVMNEEPSEGRYEWVQIEN